MSTDIKILKIVRLFAPILLHAKISMTQGFSPSTTTRVIWSMLIWQCRVLLGLLSIPFYVDKPNVQWIWTWALFSGTFIPYRTVESPMFYIFASVYFAILNQPASQCFYTHQLQFVRLKPYASKLSLCAVLWQHSFT